MIFNFYCCTDPDTEIENFKHKCTKKKYRKTTLFVRKYRDENQLKIADYFFARYITKVHNFF